MLKKLIEQIKQKKLENKAIKLEKLRNKPEFTLGDLYVGEIVLQKKRRAAGLGITDHYYKIVKAFAIFTETEYNRYVHIKSNQELYNLTSYKAIVGDYAVNNVRKFQEAFPLFMRKNNFTTSTKVSRVFIEENENKMNEQLDPNQEIVDLFK